MFQKMERLTFRRLITLLLAAAGILLLLDVGCLFRHITGIPCPGCGMTRAQLAALRLDFRAAFWYHPLWFLPLPLLAGQFLFPNGLFRNKKWNTGLSIVLLILVVGVYGIRMFLYFPDTPPMEYQPNNLLRWIFSLIQGIL